MNSRYQTALVPVRASSRNIIAHMAPLYLAHSQGSPRALFEHDRQEKTACWCPRTTASWLVLPRS